MERILGCLLHYFALMPVCYECTDIGQQHCKHQQRLSRFGEGLKNVSIGCEHVDNQKRAFQYHMKQATADMQCKQDLIGIAKFIRYVQFTEASKMSSTSNRSKKYKRRKMNEKRGLAFLPRFSHFCLLSFWSISFQLRLRFWPRGGVATQSAAPEGAPGVPADFPSYLYLWYLSLNTNWEIQIPKDKTTN